MQEVLDLIHNHGDLFYLITFIWTALEGETFVIFAAIAAHRGILDVFPLFLAAWLGSFTGDQIFFWLGRHYGKRIVHKMPRIQPKLAKVFQALEKHATIFILSYRFLYGVRNVSGIATGMSDIAWPRFLVLNLTAAGVWAGAFCAAGYYFGDLMSRMTGDENGAGTAVHKAMAMMLALLVVMFVVRYFVSKAIRRRAERKESPKLPPSEL